MSLLFWSLARPDDPEPTTPAGELPDYAMLFVDGVCIKRPGRPGGAGPQRQHLAVHEGWDVVRDVFMPADGVPHRIEVEYRRQGYTGSISGRIDLGMVTVGAANDDEGEGAHAFTGPASIVDLALAYTHRAEQRTHAMALAALERQDAAHAAQLHEMRAGHGLMLQMIKASGDAQTAALQATAAQLAQIASQSIASAEKIATRQAASSATAPAAGVTMAGALSTAGQVIQLGKGLVASLGGVEGIKDKLSGLAGMLGGGAAGGGASVLGKAIDGAIELGHMVLAERAEERAAKLASALPSPPPPAAIADDGQAA